MNAYLPIRIPVNGIIVNAAMAAIFVFAPSELMAQRFAIRAQGGPKWAAKLHEEFTQRLTEMKAEAEDRMASLLREIDQTCDLSDAQLKKLKVASKGAIEAYMASETEKIVDATKGVGFDFDPNNPPDVKEEDNGKIEFNQARGFQIIEFNSEKENADVESQTIWINALKKTLSEQQNKQLESSLEQRNHSLRKSAVEAFIAKVDLKLLLMPDQREKLALLVDKHHGQQLAEELETPKRQNEQIIVLGEGQAIARPDVEIHPEIATILSESQKNQWIRNFQPELDQLGRPN